ncbi:hypothetical protein RFI_29835, partial [Reticulomyxa filosa]
VYFLKNQKQENYFFNISKDNNITDQFFFRLTEKKGHTNMNNLNDIKAESGKYTYLFSSFGCNFSGNEGELNEHLKQKLKRHLDVVLENMNILKNKNYVLQFNMFKNKIKGQQKNLKKDIEELKLNMNIISELEEIIKKKRSFTEINDEIITKIKDEVIAVIKDKEILKTEVDGKNDDATSLESIFKNVLILDSQKVTKLSSLYNEAVLFIDYLTLNTSELICSGSRDKKVFVCDLNKNIQLKAFNRHTHDISFVKFSSYHYNNYNCTVICSASQDKTIRFCDIKDDKEFQVFKESKWGINCIQFSPFNGGRYFCSGSHGKIIDLLDMETSKLLHSFNEHTNSIRIVEFSSLQSNSNNNVNSNINCVKYSRISDKNTILSGSSDKTIRVWDTRAKDEAKRFEGHMKDLTAVEYLLLVKNDINSANTICSSSYDKTIRLWDIQMNKELCAIQRHSPILCFQILPFKNKERNETSNEVNICYGLRKGETNILSLS